MKGTMQHLIEGNQSLPVLSFTKDLVLDIVHLSVQHSVQPLVLDSVQGSAPDSAPDSVPGLAVPGSVPVIVLFLVQGKHHPVQQLHLLTSLMMMDTFMEVRLTIHGITKGLSKNGFLMTIIDHNQAREVELNHADNSNTAAQTLELLKYTRKVMRVDQTNIAI